MRVLITLDGSELAGQALATMAPWLKSWNAETVLLTVLDPREAHDTLEGDARVLDIPPGRMEKLGLQGAAVEPDRRLAEDRGQALEARRMATEEALADAAKAHLGSTPWRAAVVFAEDTAEAIAGFAEKEAVDFVAMSTHGRSGLGQALFGSVAAAVIRRLEVPAIVVGAHVPVREGTRELAAAR